MNIYTKVSKINTLDSKFSASSKTLLNELILTETFHKDQWMLL